MSKVIISHAFPTLKEAEEFKSDYLASYDPDGYDTDLRIQSKTKTIPGEATQYESEFLVVGSRRSSCD